jgi:ATP-dependent Lon protease
MSSSDSTSVQVNFGRPIPIFPLPGVVLLPQQVVPLHVFEPRYRQMVARSLDASGQIALAVFAGSEWKKNYHGRPRIRRAVCLGQITTHETLPEEQYNILLQGICRARIVRELPAEEGTLYRQAMLEPVGVSEDDEDDLAPVRGRLEQMLSGGPLARARIAEPLLEYIRNEEIPTTAILEIVSFTILGDTLGDAELRYRLLAEGNAGVRAELIETQLTSIEGLIKRALAQHPEEWPKGCSWN